MAYTICLQDWITVSANAATTIVQPEAGWQDVADFQDLAFYIEVGSTASTGTLTVQGSPTKDEAFFGAMVGAGSPYLVSYALNTGGVQGLAVVRWEASTTNQIPARWLRWQVAFTGAGTSTFRIWIAGNQAGRRWNPGSSPLDRPSPSIQPAPRAAWSASSGFGRSDTPAPRAIKPR